MVTPLWYLRLIPTLVLCSKAVTSKTTKTRSFQNKLWEIHQPRHMTELFSILQLCKSYFLVNRILLCETILSQNDITVLWKYFGSQIIGSQLRINGNWKQSYKYKYAIYKLNYTIKAWWNKKTKKEPKKKKQLKVSTSLTVS